MNDNTANMKKNVMWNTVGSVFYCACQWLITIIVVRIASYQAAGYLSLAMTTSSSFSAISLFSMRNFQVSDVTDEYHSNEYTGSRVISCAFAFVCCAIVAIKGNSIYQMLCIDAFMCVRLAEAVVDVLHGVNQKHDRYDLIGKSYIIRGIATVISFSVILAVWNDLLIALCCMAALNLLIAFAYDWKKTSSLEMIKPVVCDSRVLQLLKQCIPIVIFTFLLSLENLIPKTVLQEIFGIDQLGIYSSIASPTLVVQVFASVAFNPFLPKFSLVYSNKEYEKFSKLLHMLYFALTGMCITVTIGAVILGHWGLNLLFGKSILVYYELFMPIVWVTILTAIVWILSSIIVALRQIKWLLIGMIGDFIICVVIVRPCIIQFEKNGVSIVQIIALGIYILFMIGICEVTLQKDKRREK